MMKIEKIPLEDNPKNPGHPNHRGIALNLIEEACALKINELVDAHNEQQ